MTSGDKCECHSCQNFETEIKNSGKCPNCENGDLHNAGAVCYDASDIGQSWVTESDVIWTSYHSWSICDVCQYFGSWIIGTQKEIDEEIVN